LNLRFNGCGGGFYRQVNGGFGTPAGEAIVFIRAEGFDTQEPAFRWESFRAVKKVLNPECITSGEQHTSSFRARLLISWRLEYDILS
jgi:hypothetical protein